METKEVIRSLRAKAGLSQEELAEKTYVTRQAVSRWENGDSVPAPETLKLAAVFEKDPAGRIAAAGDILNQWKMEYRRML